MSQAIRVRDVVRGGVYDLGPGEPVMRVSYDLFHPGGLVRQHGDLVDWVQGGQVRSARAVPAKLGDVHTGERVLVHLAPRSSEDEWWLCDVEAVDGESTN